MIADLQISPHPETEGLTRTELKSLLVEAEEKLRRAKELQNPELETWFSQEIRSCEAALARRNGVSVDAKIPVTVILSEVQREQVSWLWEGRIPRGKLTLFDGDPGVGKSWLTLAIAAAVSKGHPLPGEPPSGQPERVLLMTAEDGLGDTVRPRLEDMAADLEHVKALTGLRDKEGRERALTLADIDALEKTLADWKPGLLVVDPIIAYTAGADTHKANEVRGLLAPLAALAEKHVCAILGVRHLTKNSAQAIYRGQGSIDFLAACRSAFLVAENPDSPDERVLCHLKCNLAPKAPSLTFSIKQGRFLWGAASSLTPERVLAIPIQGEERSQLEDAKGFLSEVLASGPFPVLDIFKQARKAGIAEKTLRRAKAALGVEAEKVGFDTGWTWKLPPKMAKNSLDGQEKSVGIFDKDDHLRPGDEGWEELP